MLLDKAAGPAGIMLLTCCRPTAGKMLTTCCRPTAGKKAYKSAKLRWLPAYATGRPEKNLKIAAALQPVNHIENWPAYGRL
jgi:hypothetical protein